MPYLVFCVKAIFDVFSDLARCENPAGSADQIRLVFDSIVGAAVLSRALGDNALLANTRVAALSALQQRHDHTFV